MARFSKKFEQKYMINYDAVAYIQFGRVSNVATGRTKPVLTIHFMGREEALSITDEREINQFLMGMNERESDRWSPSEH